MTEQNLSRHVLCSDLFTRHRPFVPAKECLCLEKRDKVKRFFEAIQRFGMNVFIFACHCRLPVSTTNTFNRDMTDFCRHELKHDR